MKFAMVSWKPSRAATIGDRRCADRPVNANSGNPHSSQSSRLVAMREGDFVLLDVWARKNTPGCGCYDITWVGLSADSVGPAEEILKIVSGRVYRREDGDRCLATASPNLAAKPIDGWAVDQAVPPPAPHSDAKYGD